MAANRFYRRFVTEILRESTSAAPKGTPAVAEILREPTMVHLKDLYVGKRSGKFVKPWVGAVASTDSVGPYYCVSTPGDGYRCEIAPESGRGYRVLRYI
jgi:hypothetical protein